MAKSQIKWNLRAFRELRLEPGVIDDLGERADAIADAAGPGYEASTFEGKNRGRASVITANANARRDNARNQTLIRSLDAGR
ncbi:hypothetical protein [Microbacterium sp. TPD7012]|uniref:hypothetical protein n=1 Tax=Microbacterium sp. TPD7012 TaxID=2171975 RepID=UPI000D5204A9|nr:hypothetical protein [Microbacterium sp. TPD7012]PVE94994.1 hypothetical protein DC434_13800 [Microbacterium sp. TPD7012]